MVNSGGGGIDGGGGNFSRLPTDLDCDERNPPGTTNAAFVLWAAQLDITHLSRTPVIVCNGRGGRGVGMTPENSKD